MYFFQCFCSIDFKFSLGLPYSQLQYSSKIIIFQSSNLLNLIINYEEIAHFTEKFDWNTSFKSFLANRELHIVLAKFQK